MWSKTIDFRTRPASDQKIGLGLGLARCGLGLSLGLAGLVLCCETRSCYARRHSDLEGNRLTATFQVLLTVSQFCAWNITTVEINSGVYFTCNIMNACELTTVA